MNTANSSETKALALISANVGSEKEAKVSKFLERRKDPPPKVNTTRLEDEGDGCELLAKYAEAMGSISNDFQSLVLQQVGALQGLSDKSTLLNAALALLHSMKPRNEVETMLITELFMFHNLIAEMTRRLIVSNDPRVNDSFVNRIDKLSRAARETLASFQKYRGQGIQQKVTVEHVHIHQGAQAIVGAVNRTGEGERS